MPLPSCGKTLKYTLKKTNAKTNDKIHVTIHNPHQRSQACQSKKPLKRHMKRPCPCDPQRIRQFGIGQCRGKNPDQNINQ